LTAFAAHLPVFYHGLFPTERPGAIGPEHARSKMSLGFQVLEHQGDLTRHG
jgi:hypothetical protein